MPPSSYTVDSEDLDLWLDNNDQAAGSSIVVQDATQTLSSLPTTEKKHPFMNADSYDLCVECPLFDVNTTTPAWAQNNTIPTAQLPSDHATKPYAVEVNDAMNLPWNCYSSSPTCNNPQNTPFSFEPPAENLVENSFHGHVQPKSQMRCDRNMEIHTELKNQ